VQVLPVAFEVTGARPGSYRGKIEVALDTGLIVASAQVPLVVNPLNVAVAVDGSLDGFAPTADRAVTLVLTVEDAIVRPIEVAVTVDRAGLPPGVSIQTLETTALRRAGDARVPVKFRTAAGAQAGTWHPKVSLSAGEGIVIEPSSVELTVVVPPSTVAVASLVEPGDSQRSLWVLLSVLAVALTALSAHYVGRSKDDMLLQANG
jgi:hypothetical protein